MKQNTTRAADSGAGLADVWPNTRPKNPLKVAAGKSRRPWSTEDRQRLREQCQQRKPWLVSTGPRTYLGKRKSAANGRRRLADPNSVRQLRLSLSDVGGMAAAMAELRRSLDGRRQNSS